MNSDVNDNQTDNFHQLRKEYQTAGIDDAQLLDDPIKQFRIWLAAAVEASPGDWFEANAMTLATSDCAGHVTARVVLLKGIDQGGLRFYTNYESVKGQQLAENPFACVVFNWPHQGRQVRMEGRVEKTSREDSENYFHSRPRGAQLGATVSAQSAKIESRQQLQDARNELDQKLAGQTIPLPKTWGGYSLTVSQCEFWQGRLDRLHDRVVYQQAAQAWSHFRISP